MKSTVTFLVILGLVLQPAKAFYACQGYLFNPVDDIELKYVKPITIGHQVIAKGSLPDTQNPK